MRAFYLNHILRPLFVFQVLHVPRFADYAYEWSMNLQRQVHGKLLQPDYIAQIRAAIGNKE